MSRITEHELKQMKHRLLSNRLQTQEDIDRDGDTLHLIAEVRRLYQVIEEAGI